MARVLVVDPDVARRSMIRGRIADTGNGALAALSGAEGMDKVEDGWVDLVLLSTRLEAPDDANETCRRLKSRAGYPPTVIIYEAEGAAVDAELAFEAGCDRFVSARELPVLEQVVHAVLQSKMDVDAAREHNRMLELERQSMMASAGATPAALRGSLAPHQSAGRPDAVFIIDSTSTVVSSDAGAHRIFGKDHEGRSLDDLAPGRGLLAHIRDARCASIEGLRFDLPGRGGRPARHFQASVYPLQASSSKEPQGMRVILFVDIGRRMHEGLLREQELGMTERHVSNLMETAVLAYGPHTIVGDSPASQALRQAVIEGAGNARPLLVVGPRGTRRRNVARAVHYGVEHPGPFLFMHCASLSTESLEAEFFGSTGGDYTGCGSDRQGLLGLAAGGTLLLEEIELLPLSLQDRLGEAMSAGSYRRGGALDETPMDVRIIASSLHDHETIRKRGSVSATLLAALGAAVIRVPSLAERGADLALFARQVLDRIAGRETSKMLATEVQWLLEQHDWPENLDELEASLRRAYGRARGDRIRIEHLEPLLRRLYADLIARGLAPQPRAESLVNSGTNWTSTTESCAAHEWDVTPDDPVSFEAYERKAILRALAACGGDKQKVARMLRVGKSTLYRKLNRLGI